MKIEINKDGTISIDGKKFVEAKAVDVTCLPEPSFPTIEEIYGSVKPMHWIRVNGELMEIFIHDSFNSKNCKTNIPTKEDAEYILASMQLINIAKFYNSKYPGEDKNQFIVYNGEENIIQYIKDHFYNNCGQINFTQSAAKEAIENPNVIEVLNKYFKIK